VYHYNASLEEALQEQERQKWFDCKLEENGIFKDHINCSQGNQLTLPVAIHQQYQGNMEHWTWNGNAFSELNPMTVTTSVDVQQKLRGMQTTTSLN